MRLFFIKAVFLLSLLTAVAPIAASAQRGGTSGGGAPKPHSQIGYENLQAITKSEKVWEALTTAFYITNVNQTSVDDKGWHYEVRATNLSEEFQCSFEVTVWNTLATPMADVVVKEVKNKKGCVVVRPEPLEIVHTKYKEVFDQFPKGVFQDRTIPFAGFMKVAQDLTPEKRKEIIDYVKLAHPAYYQLFSTRGKDFAEMVKKYPNLTGNEFLGALNRVMGYAGQGGISMAVVNGFEIAPFFIAEEMLKMN